MRWLLKLYGLVMSGLGIILSLAWSSFHIFALSVTNLQELLLHAKNGEAMYALPCIEHLAERVPKPKTSG